MLVSKYPKFTSDVSHLQPALRLKSRKSKDMSTRSIKSARSSRSSSPGASDCESSFIYASDDEGRRRRKSVSVRSLSPTSRLSIKTSDASTITSVGSDLHRKTKKHVSDALVFEMASAFSGLKASTAPASTVVLQRKPLTSSVDTTAPDITTFSMMPNMSMESESHVPFDLRRDTVFSSHKDKFIDGFQLDFSALDNIGDEWFTGSVFDDDDFEHDAGYDIDESFRMKKRNSNAINRRTPIAPASSPTVHSKAYYAPLALESDSSSPSWMPATSDINEDVDATTTMMNEDVFGRSPLGEHSEDDPDASMYDVDISSSFWSLEPPTTTNQHPHKTNTTFASTSMVVPEEAMRRLEAEPHPSDYYCHPTTYAHGVRAPLSPALLEEPVPMLHGGTDGSPTATVYHTTYVDAVPRAIATPPPLPLYVHVKREASSTSSIATSGCEVPGAERSSSCDQIKLGSLEFTRRRGSSSSSLNNTMSTGRGTSASSPRSPPTPPAAACAGGGSLHQHGGWSSASYGGTTASIGEDSGAGNYGTFPCTSAAMPTRGRSHSNCSSVSSGAASTTETGFFHHSGLRDSFHDSGYHTSPSHHHTGSLTGADSQKAVGFYSSSSSVPYQFKKTPFAPMDYNSYKGTTSYNTVSSSSSIATGDSSLSTGDKVSRRSPPISASTVAASGGGYYYPPGEAYDGGAGYGTNSSSYSSSRGVSAASSASTASSSAATGSFATGGASSGAAGVWNPLRSSSLTGYRHPITTNASDSKSAGGDYAATRGTATCSSTTSKNSIRRAIRSYGDVPAAEEVVALPADDRDDARDFTVQEETKRLFYQSSTHNASAIASHEGATSIASGEPHHTIVSGGHAAVPSMFRGRLIAVIPPCTAPNSPSGHRSSSNSNRQHAPLSPRSNAAVPMVFPSSQYQPASMMMVHPAPHEMFVGHNGMYSTMMPPAIAVPMVISPMPTYGSPLSAAATNSSTPPTLLFTAASGSGTGNTDTRWMPAVNVPPITMVVKPVTATAAVPPPAAGGFPASYDDSSSGGGYAPYTTYYNSSTVAPPAHHAAYVHGGAAYGGPSSPASAAPAVSVGAMSTMRAAAAEYNHSREKTRTYAEGGTGYGSSSPATSEPNLDGAPARTSSVLGPDLFYAESEGAMDGRAGDDVSGGAKRSGEETAELS